MNPGTQLGPYRLESLIGAGGMGEVYLGVDTRLDRQVAIKVLSKHLAGDASLRERFEREARTISSLSHPNICTLFDLGHHEGTDFLVMEYLQGETLAERIEKGPIPPRDVIRIGTAIAQALAAAHRQGIVHRDLKPGNVMLTKAGVKLLDFGLAKLSVSAASGQSNVLTLGATEQKPLTEQGTILGTFQYMAPEQIEGLQADARTDLFALGAILYEMATGRRAFQGATKASLIAAIIDRDPPPMSELQPLTPPSLERVVRACLAKDPNERIQTAHDVAMQLRWIGESSSAIEAVNVKRRRRLTPWMLAAPFALAAVVLGAFLWREKTRPAPAWSLDIMAPRGYVISAGAVSPDGKSVALVMEQQATHAISLWVRRLDDGTERQLVTSDALFPFWSPDGRWIGYRERPDRLMRIRVDGGQPELVARVRAEGRPAWGDDGTILVCPAFGSGLSRVAATGGELTTLTRLDRARRESVHISPYFLPGGRKFLYIVRTVAEERNEIWAGSLDGATSVHVVDADALVGYAEPYLLFVRNGAIYAQRFDPGESKVSGEGERFVDDVAFFESSAAAAVSLAPGGELMYASYPSARARLNVYDRMGTVVETLYEDADLDSPELSSDESTMVVTKFDKTKGAADVFSVDLVRKVATKITAGLSSNHNPQLSADGATVAFYSDRAGMFDIYLQPVDGSAPARVLWKDDRDKFVDDWSPDGKYVLMTAIGPSTSGDLYVVPAAGGKPAPFVVSETREEGGTFSPDGRFVAYLVQNGQEKDLYVRGFPSGRAIRVSTDGGGVASWRADGRELIWASRGRIFTAPVDLSGATPQIGKPQELFRLQNVWSTPRFLRDGRIAILVSAPDEDVRMPVHFTTGWRTRLTPAN